jgi:lysyl-tRNA synthetase, class II
MPQEGAGQPPTGGVEKLHLDEVSGKMVSKSELKRLQKQREAEEKKQKRAAAAPPKSEKKKAAEELELNPNVRFQNFHRECHTIRTPQANVQQ